MLIAIPLILFLVLAIDPFAYCYGGGVDYLTTTVAAALSNESITTITTTTTLTVISSPICGMPPNYILPILGTIAAGILVVGFGVKKRK